MKTLRRYKTTSTTYKTGQKTGRCDIMQISVESCILDFTTEQGRSQPHSPGWARVPLSSIFLKFWSVFSYFSSNFTYFLPHFSPPGGRVAHPGRPWLRHCNRGHTYHMGNIDLKETTEEKDLGVMVHKGNSIWERGKILSFKVHKIWKEVNFPHRQQNTWWNGTENRFWISFALFLKFFVEVKALLGLIYMFMTDFLQNASVKYKTYFSVFISKWVIKDVLSAHQ